MNEVLDAIEVAAGSNYEAPGRHQTPSRKRIAATRAVVERFLENLPDDLTVVEIRHQLEEVSDED